MSGSAEVVVDTTAPDPPNVASTSASYDSTPTWTWSSSDTSGDGWYRYELDDSDLTGHTPTTANSYTVPFFSE